MSQPKRAESNTSRTLAIVAVVVLVAIAIAGIVLEQRKTAAGPTTQANGPGMTPPAPPPPLYPSGPNEILFVVDSEELPPGALDKIARIVQASKTDAKPKTFVVSTQVESPSGTDSAMALARRRGQVIHLALEADGVPSPTILTQTSQTSPGLVAPQRANMYKIEVR